MVEKLKFVKQRFDEIADLIIQPDVLADQERYVKLNKEYKDLGTILEKGREYTTVIQNMEEAKASIA